MDEPGDDSVAVEDAGELIPLKLIVLGGEIMGEMQDSGEMQHSNDSMHGSTPPTWMRGWGDGQKPGGRKMGGTRCPGGSRPTKLKGNPTHVFIASEKYTRTLLPILTYICIIYKTDIPFDKKNYEYRTNTEEAQHAPC